VSISRVAEFTVLMINLLLILIVTAVILTVVLWAGTFFFQGYIYTEPSPGIFWQAPAAAALLTFGYTIWSLSVAFSAEATPQNIPYDALHRFSPKEDMSELEGKPAPKIWAIKLDRKKTGEDKDGERIEYKRIRDAQIKFHYEATTGAHHPWQPDGVIAIEIEKPDGVKMRFDLAPLADGGNREFVSPDGWVITELSGQGGGPNVVPYKFRWGRWLLNLFFNFGHLAVWFLALWLLLRFQWTHALGLAVVLWLIFTVTVLPMLLGYSGLVALNRHVQTALVWGAGAIG
jgi:hypothetical protein